MSYVGKIKTYPFCGLNYEQIKCVADRIYFNDNFDINYIVYSCDERYNMLCKNSEIIEDDRIKCVLFYFKFLSDIGRNYNNHIHSMDSECKLPSVNTYLDTILIHINEVVSYCKENGCRPEFKDILYRFNKIYDSSDLYRLYDNKDDYNYLNELMDFIFDDDFYVGVSKFNNDGIVFNKINDGVLCDIVNDIVLNQNCINNVRYTVKNGPILSKKYSPNSVSV